MKILRVGIASYTDMKARTMAIARGQLKPSPSDPKVWFPSAETRVKALSDKNRMLLGTIRDAEPKSLAKLAELTGRKISNLSLTLKTMERYGIVKLERQRSGRVIAGMVQQRGLAHNALASVRGHGAWALPAMRFNSPHARDSGSIQRQEKTVRLALPAEPIPSQFSASSGSGQGFSRN